MHKTYFPAIIEFVVLLEMNLTFSRCFIWSDQKSGGAVLGPDGKVERPAECNQQ